MDNENKENTEKVKVQWFNNKANLNEIYQKTNIIFAFAGIDSLTKEIVACHDWIKCKDFLHDAMRAQLTNKPCEIYGFKFYPGKNPRIDTNKMRILVSKDGLKDETVLDFKRKIIAGLSLVNHFEKYAGISLTKVEEVDTKNYKKKCVYMFVGPKTWLSSPFLISMYTFLIRLGDKEIIFNNARTLKKELHTLTKQGSGGDNDLGYLSSLWNKLHKIIKQRNELFTKDERQKVHDIYFKNYSLGTFHNCAGVLSLANGVTPDKDLNKKIK